MIRLQSARSATIRKSVQDAIWHRISYRAHASVSIAVMDAVVQRGNWWTIKENVSSVVSRRLDQEMKRRIYP